MFRNIKTIDVRRGFDFLVHFMGLQLSTDELPLSLKHTLCTLGTLDVFRANETSCLGPGDTVSSADSRRS